MVLCLHANTCLHMLQSVTGLEARLAAVLQELGKQSELHRAAEKQELLLQKKMQTLESELFTTGVSKDEQSRERQHVRSHRCNLFTTLHLSISVGIFLTNSNFACLHTLLKVQKQHMIIPQ